MKETVKNHTTKEAAEYLVQTYGVRRSPGYLVQLRIVGGGPRFVRAGRSVLYPEMELDAWATKLLGPVVSSTAEADTLKARHVA